MGNYWSGTIPSVLDERINSNCIVVYSTTVCGFCSKTKTLLDDMNLMYDVIELDLLSRNEGGKMSQLLREKTRMLTVPQIFINGEFVGGYMELLAIKKAGSLFDKISKCKVSCITSDQLAGSPT